MINAHRLDLPLAFCSLLFLTACAPSAKLKPPSTGARSLVDLRQRFDQILADSALARSTAGVKIVSLRTGETLYERNANLLFHPASNQKLLTSATALAVLGPNFIFHTIVACDSTAQLDRSVQGDLYLIGRGNPDLTSEDLFRLAKDLAQMGISEIQGNLVCDDFYFDDVRWGSGWMWDDEPSSLWSRFSALTVNDNAVVVRVAPAEKVGQPAWVQIDPPTDHMTLINTSVTVARKAQIDSLGLSSLLVTRQWQQHENIVVVDGAIAQDEQPDESVINVLEPELYCGRVFREALKQAGITVHGVVQRGLAPAKIKILAEHRAPLLPVLINLNKTSDNLTAELLLKTIGAEKFGWPGSAEKGGRAIRQFLGSNGVDTTAIKIADGSGVSRYNLVTPAEIVKLLTAVWKNFAIRNEFTATLPIAGMDGTLRSRMRGTPAAGVIHAKTGTLSGVSTLSGYTITSDGEELAFSMMMQHYLVREAAIRSVQDRLGAELCAFRREK